MQQPPSPGHPRCFVHRHLPLPLLHLFLLLLLPLLPSAVSRVGTFTCTEQSALSRKSTLLPSSAPSPNMCQGHALDCTKIWRKLRSCIRTSLLTLLANFYWPRTNGGSGWRRQAKRRESSCSFFKRRLRSPRILKPKWTFLHSFWYSCHLRDFVIYIYH
jgi:hypothetical protein